MPVSLHEWVGRRLSIHIIYDRSSRARNLMNAIIINVDAG